MDPIMLLTKKLRTQLPGIGTTQQSPDPTILCKFFDPCGSWTWYATEFDGEDIFYGLVIGHYKEFGTFALSELRTVHGKLGLPVERDLYFTPTSLAALYE